MITMKNIFTLLLSLFAFTALAGETPKISQQELLTALDKETANIVVLDVRSAEEYNDGHVPGAINFSHNTIEDSLSQLAQYKDKTVVVYCRSGRRAGVAEGILASNGFTDLRHLTGDMNGWVAAKLPIAK